MPDVDALFGVRIDPADSNSQLQSIGVTSRTTFTEMGSSAQEAASTIAGAFTRSVGTITAELEVAKVKVADLRSELLQNADKPGFVAGLAAELDDAIPRVQSLQNELKSAFKVPEDEVPKSYALFEGLKSAIENPTKAAGAFSEILKEGIVSSGGAAAVAIVGVAGVLGAATYELLKFNAEANKTAAEINDISEMSGVAVPQVSAMKFAFESAGGTVKDLDATVFTLDQRMETSGKKVDEGLTQIGLSLQKIQTLPADERILAISDAMRGAGSETNKAAVAMEIFGMRGRTMLPELLKPLRDFSDEAKQTGLTLSGEAAQGAEDFETALAKQNATIDASYTKLGLTLSPLQSLRTYWADLRGEWALDIAQAVGVIDKLKFIDDLADQIAGRKGPDTDPISAQVAAQAEAQKKSKEAADNLETAEYRAKNSIESVGNASKTTAAALMLHVGIVDQLKAATDSDASSQAGAAKSTAYLSAVTKELTDSARNSIETHKQSAAAIKTGQKAIDEWALAMANATSSASTLSGAQVEGIRWFLAAGASAEQTAKLMGVFVEQVKQVQAFDAFNARLDAATSSMTDLSGAQVEGIRYFLSLKVSADEVAKIMGVYKEQVDQVKAAETAAIGIRRLELEVNDNLAASLAKLPKLMDPVMDASKKNEDATKGLDDQIRKLGIDLLDISPFDKRRAEVAAWVVEESEKLRTLGVNYDVEYAKIVAVAKLRYAQITKESTKAAKDQEKAFVSSIQAIGTSLANMGKAIGGNTSPFFDWASNAVNAFAAVRGSLDQLNDSFDTMTGKNDKIKNFGQGLSGIVSGGLSLVAGVMQGSRGKNLWESILGGAISGAGLGWQGAIAGAVVGAITYLGSSDPVKDAADKAGRFLGQRISDSLGGQIDQDSLKILDKLSSRLDTSKSLEGYVSDLDALKAQADNASALLNLDKVIAEAGGVATYGLDKTMSQVEDLFKQIQLGTLTVDQVGKEFDKIFTELLPAVMDTATGLVSKKFVEMQNAAIAAGVSSPALDAFRKQQVGGAMSGLAGYLTRGSDAIDKEKELTDKLNGLIVQYRSASSTDQVKLKKEMDETAAALEKQRLLMTTLAVTSQSSASAMANGIVASFSELRRQGMSVQDAIEQILPAADGLQKQLDRAGLSGGAAFKGLRDMIDMTKDEVAGPAIQAMTDLGDTIKGLANTGLLTEDDFAGLANQIGTTYASLIAQGKDGSTALRLMQPELQTLWEQQQRFGTALDENTQRMLDDAAASGLVGESQKSAADQEVDATNRVANVLTLMAKAMGIDVPAAADAMATGVSNAADKAAGALTSKTGKSIDDLKTKVGDVPFTKWQDAVTNGGIAGGLKIVTDDMGNVLDTVDDTNDKFKLWAKESGKEGATGELTESVGGIQGTLELVSGKLGDSTKDFNTWADRAVAAVNRVSGAVNALNFGRSPGGLKELFPFISGATSAFDDFSKSGVAAASRVKTQLDALSLAQASRMMIAPGPSAMAAIASTQQPRPAAPPPQQITYVQYNYVDAIDTDSVKKRLEEWTPMMMENARINTNDAGTMLNARVREVRRGRRR